MEHLLEYVECSKLADPDEFACVHEMQLNLLAKAVRRSRGDPFYPFFSSHDLIKWYIENLRSRLVFLVMATISLLG